MLRRLRPWFKWFLAAAIWSLLFAGHQLFRFIAISIPRTFADLIPIIVILLCVVLLLYRPTQTLAFFFYLAVFPLWLLFVFLPVNVFRLGKSLAKLASLVMTIGRSAKFNLIVVAFGIFSAVSIWNHWNVAFSQAYLAVILLLILLLHVHLFVFAFRPGIGHRLLANFVSQYWKWLQTDISRGEARRVSLNPTDRLKAVASLGNGVLAILQKYQGAHVLLGMFIIGLGVYFVLLTFLFGAAYYATLTIEPRSFALLNQPSFSDIYLFSATNMLGTHFGDVIPRSTTARTLAALQLVSSVTIGVIVLLVFTTLGRERFQQELDDAINNVKQTISAVDEQIKNIQSKEGDTGLLPSSH